MNSRFGIKDFFLFILVFALIVSVWLMMRQQDRQWEKNQELLRKMTTVESQLSRMSDRLDSRGVSPVNSVVVRPATNPVQSPSTSPSSGGGGHARDESWARPGVKVEWFPLPMPASPPEAVQGYQAGGEFTEAWETSWPRLTPFISTDVYYRRISDLVMESLGSYNPKALVMEGQLAEAWQIDPSGLWLRARLREGVRFSDGEPITAEDFRWTFQDVVMNEQIEAEATRSIIRDSIKKVVVVDARTVEYEFYEPLFTNVNNALSLEVLPKHVYSKFTPGQLNRSTGLLMGSGPFRLKDFDPDRQWAPEADVVLERNEQYWGVKPALSVLRFKAIKDETPRINAFKSGAADMITPASAQFVTMSEDPQWKDKAQFLKWTNMRSPYSFIGWNGGLRDGKKTPFHDKRVRRAMTHMLDRERMIKEIYKGIGVVAKGNLPLNSAGSDPSIKPLPYDPELAKKLLKEAGWEDRDGDGVIEDASGNPFEFEIVYGSGGEIPEKIAGFITDAAAAVGVRVKRLPSEWAMVLEKKKSRDFDAIMMGWGSNAPESDPKQIFHSSSIKNQGDNFVQWNCPEADRLIEAGRREMVFDKRMKIWQEFERLLQDEQPYTFFRVSPWLRIANPEIKNIIMHPKSLEHVEFFRGGPDSPVQPN